MSAPIRRISQCSEANLITREALLHPERFDWKTLSPTKWPFRLGDRKNLRFTCKHCGRVVTSPLVIQDTLLCEACGHYNFTIEEAQPRKQGWKLPSLPYVRLLGIAAGIILVVCLLGWGIKQITTPSPYPDFARWEAEAAPQSTSSSSSAPSYAEVEKELARASEELERATLTGHHGVDSYGNRRSPSSCAPCYQQVKNLLAEGADPGKRDSSGNTPLHRAAADGCILLCTKLIAYGADVDARDAQGRTPLMRAADAHKKRAVEILLQHGADRNLRDNTGRKALDYANGWSDIMNLLQPYGSWN